MIACRPARGNPAADPEKECRLAARKSPPRRPAAANRSAPKSGGAKSGAKSAGAKSAGAKSAGAKSGAKAAGVKASAAKAAPAKPKKIKVHRPAAAEAIPSGPADGHPAYPLARAAGAAALDKKAENVLILDVRGLTSYADFFVIASGTSDRQVQAIADSIEETLKKDGERPIGVEGQQNGHWVLIDYGDVVCHVMYEDARVLYDLEGLWADAPRITLEG